MLLHLNFYAKSTINQNKINQNHLHLCIRHFIQSDQQCIQVPCSNSYRKVLLSIKVLVFKDRSSHIYSLHYIFHYCVMVIILMTCSRSERLPQLIFQTAYLQTMRLGRRHTKTAHGGLQRSCGSAREIWQMRKLSLPLFSTAHSLPSSPCRLIELTMPVLRGCPPDHAGHECMCVSVSVHTCVCVLVKEDDGSKRDMEMRARLALPELASKE